MHGCLPFTFALSILSLVPFFFNLIIVTVSEGGAHHVAVAPYVKTHSVFGDMQIKNKYKMKKIVSLNGYNIVVIDTQ